jgi:hypothetical protein
MSIAFAFGETVVITRQTVNAYGDHSDGETITIDGVAVWPTQSKETIEGGMDTVTFGLTCLFPEGTDIRATDTVTVRDLVYRVDGEPSLFTSPLTNTTSGIEVQLLMATG